MGYSDHLAQYVCMKPFQVQEGQKMMYIRQFTNSNMHYFKYLICDEKWTEATELYEPNNSFILFINICIYYFNIAFRVKKNEVKANNIIQRWITKGLIVSRNKLRILQ